MRTRIKVRPEEARRKHGAEWNNPCLSATNAILFSLAFFVLRELDENLVRTGTQWSSSNFYEIKRFDNPPPSA